MTSVDPYPILLISISIFLIPLVVVGMTAFLKISVVLFIVRSALSVQQTPPNIVLYAIALVLTCYVMAPVGVEISAVLQDFDASNASINEIRIVFNEAIEPLRSFIFRFSAPEQRAFFLSATEEIWPIELRSDLNENDLIILVPAFITSELTRAFEIGILLFLPFIVIDLVITNILTAMGMMMVSPTVISLPFKLLLFVAVDGWARLTHGVVLSYA